MKQVLILLNIAIGLLFISFIGIKYHPKFSERFVIVKHRPSLHFIFYSPIGDSDKTLDELSPNEQEQELLYREFIKRPHARTIDNMALVFFQLGVYLIISSLLRLVFFRRKYKPKLVRVLTINVIAISILLGMYQIFWTQQLSFWAIITIQIVLNLGLVFPLLRKNR